MDAIIHLGMAFGWEWYSVEERAFNERMTSDWWGLNEEKAGYYLIPDDKGKTVRDIGGKLKGIWDEAPMGLKAAKLNTRIVVEDVGKAVNHDAAGDEYQKLIEGQFGGRLVKHGVKKKMRVEVILHDEAGSYGCGFIFYESLATVWKRKLNTRVLFCHVPGWKDEERLERGADFVCAVIGAVCRQIDPTRPERIMAPPE